MFLRICFLAWTTLSLSAQTPIIPLHPGSPFSANAVTENAKPQSDGTSTVTKAVSILARDSKGRTRVERHYPVSPAGDGRVLGITISDPIAHTRTVLDPAAMQATVYNLPDEPEKRLAQPPNVANSDSEDLGASVLEGLTVHGYRREETVQLGDNHSLTVTREYWYSEQLQMNIKAKNAYSEGRTESFTLTQVSLNEPDAALFQVPPEYNVTSTLGAVRIGAAVAEANLVTYVEPEYPALAKSARVQGTVEFNAIIGSDGVIKNLELVRGHPLLVNAAKDAVLQWKYRPTLLNGNAVAVLAPIQVKFTLSDQN